MGNNGGKNSIYLVYRDNHIEPKSIIQRFVKILFALGS
jgi:hypothetical protein